MLSYSVLKLSYVGNPGVLLAVPAVGISNGQPPQRQRPNSGRSPSSTARLRSRSNSRGRTYCVPRLLSACPPLEDFRQQHGICSASPGLWRRVRCKYKDRRAQVTKSAGVTCQSMLTSDIVQERRKAQGAQNARPDRKRTGPQPQVHGNRDGDVQRITESCKEPQVVRWRHDAM